MKNNCDKLLDTLKSFDTSLGDLRLKWATYNKTSNSLDLELISDVAVLSEGKDFIKKSILKELSYLSDVNVEIHKSICDKDLAKKAIKKYLDDKCFSISHLISSDNIKVLTANKKVVFELLVSDEIADYIERTNELENMGEYLYRNYSNVFEGSLRKTQIVSEEAPSYEVQSVDYGELEDSTLRYHKVQNVLKFCDDTLYDTAIYIEDGESILGNVYYAGEVTQKEERVTKNGKPFFTITINDKTGNLTGRFFTADKNKLRKLEKIDVGSIIIVRGVNEIFNGSTSFSIKGFHLCEFPKNYQIKEKPSKRAPENYSLVFPKNVEISKQDDFFTADVVLPVEILNGTYTVVDIETTGTEINYDKITEIGAVKVINGVIKEQFHTLVNPEISIPERIIELTGIDDELVKDAPTIDMVYPDFFKFLQGSVFVAHNVEFDYRFLKRVGKDLGYVINNETLDTLYLSRKILPSLKNHKLNTVCEHFNITFRHHRALADAYATAEALLELLKGKKSLKDI